MTPAELELIAARDEGAMGRFYDSHIAVVRRFCGALCPPDRLDEATEATLVAFLARASEAAPAERPDELLRKAAREVAAHRMEPGDGSGAGPVGSICRAMPELLAARANGELSRAEGRTAAHLESCGVCRATAARLERAEAAFGTESEIEQPTNGSERWLELAAPGAPAADVSPQAPQAQPAQSSRSPSAAAQPSTSAGSFEAPARVRVRRGGLVGAVRRLAAARAGERPRQENDAEDAGP